MIMSFLRRILDALLSRAFWTFVGFVLLVLLIWLIGPMLAIADYRPLESEAARLWAILMLAGLLLIRWLLRRWRRSAINAGVTERLRAMLQTSRTEESEEVKLLRSRFDEALAILRQARFGSRQGLFGRIFGGSRYLYELPWYMIIGAPGVGKTTALLNSGLNFPLTKSHGKGAIKGVGGTRNCDWWFTDQAVMIDTAGRYTTHDSDAEADRAEWLGFMSLLRKGRSHQPINGVLLTISVPELLDSSPDERRQHAETLRRRLDELREDLDIAFPVYLVVNKCDLLSGFDEYFASLDRAGREQVWGFTLPWADTADQGYSVEAVEEHVGLLQKRIDAGLVDVLQSEPELARRALIHSFPQQFALLCDCLREVGAMIFVGSRFSSAPLLRGMYFTSATQEGTPLDRVISAMGGQAPVRPASARQKGSGKSYFLHDLLTRVVFGEAHLAGHNRKVDRRARALHLAAYAASVILMLGAVGVWVASYRNNVTYLAEVDGKIERIETRLSELPPSLDGNLYPLLGALTEAETAPDSIHFQASDPLHAWTFGLYQGRKLQAASWPLYEKLLKTRLGPAIEARLEWLLRTVAVEDLEFAYEILRAYLMLHERSHFDAGMFKAFILADWDRNMPAGAARSEREALERHVSALIELGAPVTRELDKTLVDSTRGRLTQYSFAQRAYRSLVRSLENNELPAFSIGAVVGPSAPSVFRYRSGRPLTDGIPSLYTYRGYHELFAPAVSNALRHVGKDDAWVLGVSELSAREQLQAIASGELALEVKRLYMWDYVGQWERFLDDFDVVMPGSLPEATGLLKVVSSVDSPLARLLKAVVDETTLLRKSAQQGGSTDSSLFERVRRSARATQADVTRIVGPNMMPGGLGPREVPELLVDNRFAELRRAVGTGDGAAPLAGMLQSLAELHLLLGSVEAAKRGGYPPPISDLPARLKADADRMPLPGKRLLESLANTGETLVARETRVAKSNQMVGTVTRACRESIEGRYPFAVSASREVAVGDFARMFGPGGVIDSYFQQELASAVDVSASPWRLRPGVQGGLGGGGALAQFERAAVIKDVFFRSGAGVPTVTLSIKPLEMDTTITNLVLDIDGQIIRYQHGPQVGHTVRWPGDRGSGQVRVAIEPVLEHMKSGLVLEGPWALHRLFDGGRIEPGASPEHFRVVLDVGGRKAAFEVRTSSVKNPFALAEMRQFACPAGL